MRELKFRAWDGATMWHEGWNADGNAFLTAKDFLGRADLTVMQFTGLLDKNGVEIYEDEIVRATVEQLLDEVTVTASIVISPDGIMLDMGSMMIPYAACDSDTVEVIGNVHQNPELLATPTTASPTTDSTEADPLNNLEGSDV